MSNQIHVGVAPFYSDTGKYTEDGEPIIIDVYAVTATFSDGRRFEHVKRFVAEVAYDDETGAYRVPRQGMQKMEIMAEILAAKVEHHLAVGGTLNMDHWVEREAAYGTPAWEAQDAGGFYAAQEKAHDIEFEHSPPAWLKRLG